MLWMILLGLGFAQPAGAQVFHFSQDREPVVALNGLWRFHTGDNSAWAAPGFDDSSWKLLRSDDSWNDQGYRNYNGMAWYRFQVDLPAQHPPLALYVPFLLTSYQVYANGQKIGQYGGLPPQENALNPLPEIYRIPQSLLPAGQPLTIALRVWQWPDLTPVAGGGPEGGVGLTQIGDASELDHQRNLLFKQRFWEVAATSVLLLIELLAGLAGGMLFLLGSREKEYLWFGAAELLSALLMFLQAKGSFYPTGFVPYVGEQYLLNSAIDLCQLAFLFVLLRQPRGWLYWIAIGSALLGVGVAVPFAFHWVGIAGVLALGDVVSAPYLACVLILLVRGARKGNPDARLLLLPFGLDYLMSYISDGLGIAVFSGHALPHWFSAVNQWFNNTSLWPFPFSVTKVADLLLQLGLVSVLLLRFVRSRREEQRLASELEAARAVQQVLVPEKIPQVAGLAIDCVYKPAGEVGGDFFQVIPVEGGGTLVAIGDVSGKGVPAAMTVSLLVGALRMLVREKTTVAAILAEMNRMMTGRSGGGFTTCLLVRMEPDGTCTLANAGHLHPYVNGREQSLENGLPLGLAADAVYAESVIRLAAGDCLTLLTDGVVEARNREGELFGFDRTANLAAQSALFIADAAEAFGQEDDITVLTMTRDGNASIQPELLPSPA